MSTVPVTLALSPSTTCACASTVAEASAMSHAFFFMFSFCAKAARWAFPDHRGRDFAGESGEEGLDWLRGLLSIVESLQFAPRIIVAEVLRALRVLGPEAPAESSASLGDIRGPSLSPCLGPEAPAEFSGSLGEISPLSAQ